MCPPDDYADMTPVPVDREVCVYRGTEYAHHTYYHWSTVCDRCGKDDADAE